MSRNGRVLTWIGGLMLAVSALGWVMAADLMHAAGDTKAQIVSSTSHRDSAAQRVAQLEPMLVATRIDLDRDVISAAAAAQVRLNTHLCEASKAAVASDSPMPQVEPAVKAEIAGATQISPVLAEVPGWEKRLNASALQDRVNSCSEEARDEAEAERKAAERKKAATKKRSEKAEPDCGPGWFWDPAPYGGECLPTEEWLAQDRSQPAYEVPERTTNAHGDVIERSY